MTTPRTTIATVAIFLASGIASAVAGKNMQESTFRHYAELNAAEWKQVFHDPCSQDWKQKWFLDGLKATVRNGKGGMDFTAGPEAFSDAHHAVLWTKQDFQGDLKIEYEYTRLDSELRMVTILYIQATGSGKRGFEKDISVWAGKRRVPSMRTYFNNMNAYHISYAAFGTKNTMAGTDYIRGRRYMCGGLKGTELDNEYENTGLFETGVPHTITVIKRDRDIYMHIRNDDKELLCHFINSRFPPITEGKIGLRHMYTRGARYRNFKVSTLTDNRTSAAIPAKEYAIKDLADLSSRIRSAKPGDTLRLPAGTLKDWTADISTSGTKEAPITIRGQGRDKTVFSGRSAIRINGASYVHLKDLGFSDNSGTAVALNSTRDCVITNASFSEIKARSIIKLSGSGQRNQITSCHFFNNPSKNIEISIGGAKAPAGTIIRNSVFENVPPIGGNGRETIQIGQNAILYGDVEANAIVEGNRFFRCNGEAEIISNKSSGNHYRGNFFLECKGELVMRGGSGCTIENNRFENGSGGIRVSGRRHTIRNNVILNSGGAGIRLWYGVSDANPAFYQAVSECIVEHNTIVNARGTGILIGDGRGKDLLASATARKKLTGNPRRYGTNFDMTVAPHHNTIRCNVVFNQEGKLIAADNAPQNIFKDNLGCSQLTKAKADEKYLLVPLEFVDLDGGNLTLKATVEEASAKGARGSVCEPVHIEKAESEISDKAAHRDATTRAP